MDPPEEEQKHYCKCCGRDFCKHVNASRRQSWAYMRTEVAHETEKACSRLQNGWKWFRWTENWPTILALFLLITILITYIVICYMLSLDHRHTIDNLGLLITIYVCDLIYLMDSIFRLVSARRTSRKPGITRKQKVLAKFPSILDFLSLLPIEVLVYLVNSQPPALRKQDWALWNYEDGTTVVGLTGGAYGRLWTFHRHLALSKLNRLIRLYRIAMFYKKKTNELRLNLYTREVFATLVCFFCFLVLLFHGIACVWFSLSCKGIVHKDSPPECDIFGSSLVRKNQSHASTIHPVPKIYEFTKFAKTDAFGYYVGGLHWSVMSVRNAGNPLFVPENSIQTRISICVQWLGFTMMCALVLIALYVAVHVDLRRNMFFHEAKGCRSFLNYLEKPMASWIFMHKSLNYMWRGGRGFTDHNLRPILSSSLNLAIALSIFQPMLEASEILKTCFTEFEIEKLALDLRWKHYFANEYIIRPGSFGCTMFYVLNGSLDLMHERDNPPQILLTLDQGSLVGETDAFLPEFRKNGIKTREPCDLLSLSYDCTRIILDRSPRTHEKVLLKIKERLNFLRRAKERHYLLEVEGAIKNRPGDSEPGPSNRLNLENSTIPGLVFHNPLRGRKGLDDAMLKQSPNERLRTSQGLLQNNLEKIKKALRPSDQKPTTSTAANAGSDSELKRPKNNDLLSGESSKFDMYRPRHPLKKQTPQTLKKDNVSVEGKNMAEKATFQVPFRKLGKPEKVLGPMELRGQLPGQSSGSDNEIWMRDAEHELQGPRKENMKFMSCFGWLEYYKWGPEVLRRQSKAAGEKIRLETEKLLEGIERYPESRKIYRLIPTIPLPTIDWMHAVVSRQAKIVDIWELFVVTVALINAYLYPPSIMFSSRSFSRPLNLLVDAVYGLDLIFRLFIIFDPKDIYELKRCRHFWTEIFKVDILVDLIPVIPIQYLASSFMEDTIQSYRSYIYWRMHIYIVKFIRVMFYFDNWENDVRVSVLGVRLFKQINYMCLYIVLISSIFCSYACEEFPNCVTDEETWLDYYFAKELPKYDDYLKYDKSDFGFAFLLSLYWGVSTTFGVGLTNAFYLVQKRETTLQTVTLFFGFVVIAYYFVNIATTLTGIVENKIHHFDRLIWLSLYLDEVRVEEILLRQIDNVLDIQWSVLRGINTDKSHAGFLSVSHTMYKEIMVSMVADVLYKTFFFRDFDLDTLRRISMVAKFSVIPPDLCLLRDGDIVRRIFVIRRGYCEVFRGSTCLNEDMLSTGQSFGEANVVYGEISRSTIRTVTYCELITIDVEDFVDILTSSKVHSRELQMLRDDPTEFWKFQSSICVSTAQIYNQPYESETSVPVPELKFYWYGCRRDTTVKKAQDAYTHEFRRCGIFSWIRFLVVPITFLPSGWLMRGWEFIRVYVGVLIIIIFVPPSEAFPKFKETYGRWVYLADFITFVDIWVRCHTAYFQTGTKRLVTHPVWTSWNYITTGFFIDLYGSLPVFLLIDFACDYWGLDGHLHQWRMLGYLFRLNRLVFLIRWYLYRLRWNKENMSGKNNWRAVRLLTGFFLFHTHIMACVTVALGCPTTKKEFAKHGKCYPNTWITTGRHPLIHDPKVLLDGPRVYLFAFYYVATTSVGCGFGDFAPSNEVELYWAIFTFFGYILMFTYLLGSVAASRCHYDYKLLQYQQGMNYLVGFLARERIDVKLSKRIIQHYDFFWTRKQGIFPQVLMANIFPPLKKEMYVDIYDETFRLIPEFHMTPPGLVRQLCNHMIPVHYMSDEPIIEKDDVCEFLYFVMKGDVIITLENGEQLIVGQGATYKASKGNYLKSKQAINVLVLGSMDPRDVDPLNKTAARTLLNVDLYFMRREYFVKVLEAYPDIAPRFEVHGNRDVNMYNKMYANNPNATIEFYRITLIKTSPYVCNVDLSDEELDDYEDEYKKPKPRRRVKAASTARIDEELGASQQDIIHFRSTFSQAVADLGKKKKRSLDVKFDKDSLYTSSVLPAAHTFSWFKFIIYIAAMISSGISVYQFSFVNLDWTWFGIGLACDAVFYVKIGLSFFMSYYDEQGNLITSASEIENKYLSELSGFFLDFFSSLPTDAFVFVYTLLGIEDDPVRKVTTSYYVWACLRINRIPRVIIVWQYIQNQYSGMIFSVPRLKLKRLVIYSIVSLHWITCIFHYFTKRYGNDYSTGTSGFKKKCVCDQDDFYICNNSTLPPEAWFHTKNESTNIFCSPYTMTMYYITSTFTTTAYGDIYAISVFEMIFIALLSLASKVWFGLLLTDLLSGVQNYIDLSYHLSCDLTLKLYRSYGVQPDLLERVKRYLTYAWSENKGKIIPELVDIAPQCLRMEILYSMYKDHFEECYLFCKLPIPFIRHICQFLDHQWIAQGEYILRQGQVGQKLYFVHRGLIETTQHEFDEAGEIKSTATGLLDERKYFGDIQVIRGPKRHTRSYKAQTHIDLVSLSYDDFVGVLETFPLMKELFHTRLCGRYGNEIIEEVDRKIKERFLPAPNLAKRRMTLIGRDFTKTEADASF